jgi:Tol biopolymer transport system component
MRMSELGRQDIWVFDLRSGLNWRLTDTPARTEDTWSPVQLHARRFVIYSMELSSMLDAGAGFYPNVLTLVNLDGSQYEIIASVNSAATFAPGGEQIAYTTQDGLWLYDHATGPRRLRSSEYGLNEVDPPRSTSPSWSPDGTHLAYWTQTVTAAGSQLGVAVLDLSQSTSVYAEDMSPT